MPVSRVSVCPSVVWCSLLMVVGRVRVGRVVVFCCVRGVGGRRAWRSMLVPAHGTPFPFRPLHAWPVGCWPACGWSAYGCVVAAAAVWFVHGCVSPLMVGLFVVGSFRLLALSRPGLNWVLRVKARASRRGLGLVVAGMSDAGFFLLRPGCSRRVVSVWSLRSRTQAACWGLRCCCIVLAGYAFVMYGCMVFVLSPGLRVAVFVALASCALPDGRFVLLAGVWGQRRSVAVVLVVYGPPHGGACCGGVWPPSWWGVFRWCCPPPLWGVLWWCVAPLMVGCAALGCRGLCPVALWCVAPI